MADDTIEKKGLTPDERRERRRLRREKQRAENVGRAAKMHAARLAATVTEAQVIVPRSEPSAYVGCLGWFYWKWRGKFYAQEILTGDWFSHYASHFDTVEINASFFHGRPWPM